MTSLTHLRFNIPEDCFRLQITSVKQISAFSTASIFRIGLLSFDWIYLQQRQFLQLLENKQPTNLKWQLCFFFWRGTWKRNVESSLCGFCQRATGEISFPFLLGSVFSLRATLDGKVRRAKQKSVALLPTVKFHEGAWRCSEQKLESDFRKQFLQHCKALALLMVKLISKIICWKQIGRCVTRHALWKAPIGGFVRENHEFFLSIIAYTLITRISRCRLTKIRFFQGCDKPANNIKCVMSDDKSAAAKKKKVFICN